MSFFRLGPKTASTLTIREQTIFFLPLALTSLIMIITHSLFNAGLARMPRPEIMLAAFAVAKSLMHILQSPITMVRQTVTALINHRANFRRTFIFLALLVLGVVFTLAVTAFSGLSKILFRHVMGLSGRTLDEAVLMLRILFLFPLMVATRDFLSGLALKFRIAPLISIASAFRIIFVLLFISFLDAMSAIPDAYLAGIMFIGGVAIEALVLFIGSKIIVKNFTAALSNLSSAKQTKPLTYKTIGLFYIPLILTALITTSVMPLINSSLARTVEPDLALSAFAVAWSLGMIFLSPFNMFHQVTLNYYEKNNIYAHSIRKFAVVIAFLSASILLLISFTNLGYLILTRVIGTSHEVSLPANDVLKLMCLLPFVRVTREYYWGIMMKRRQTKQIWQGRAINLLTLIVALTLLVLAGPSNPSIIGAIGIICSEAAEISFHLIKGKNKKINLPAGTAAKK